MVSETGKATHHKGELPEDENSFQVVHFMMDRKKMEDIILMILNEQYIGDDNVLVPRMITDALLLDAVPTSSENDGGDGHKGCWGH